VRRTDLVIITIVLAAVVAVAGLRTSRERAAPAVATADKAGPAQPIPSEAAPTVLIPRVVDLGAGRCVPCRKMAPILAALRSEYAGRADVVFIDVWERPDLADRYRFRAIPTQIFYDRNGREAWRHEGFLDKPEIVAQFRRLGVE
jgi:thioredoxin 1